MKWCAWHLQSVATFFGFSKLVRLIIGNGSTLDHWYLSNSDLAQPSADAIRVSSGFIYVTVFTRLCPNAIRFSNLPWVSWQMGTVWFSHWVAAAGMALKVETETSSQCTCMSNIWRKNSQHSKAEKLKDRAGQIDLVKQAAQLAWAYSPDVECLQVSWPSMTGFPKILSWRCDLTSSGADCSWQFCSLHFLLLPCLLRHQGTRKFDFLATFLSLSFVGYFLEFGLWEVLVIYWDTGSGDTFVLTAQFTSFWTAWTIDFLGMSVRGWELLLGSGRLNESRFEAMVAVVFAY